MSIPRPDRRREVPLQYRGRDYSDIPLPSWALVGAWALIIGVLSGAAWLGWHWR